MNSLINDWVGRQIHVKLIGLFSPTIKAKLLKVDSSGVLLELPEGQTFVPMTSVFHISLIS